ncbi:hypothetical protein [Rhodococcus sp. ACT016]
MSSNYWHGLVNLLTAFTTVGSVGLYTASQQGGGWASLESMTSGS